MTPRPLLVATVAALAGAALLAGCDSSVRGGAAGRGTAHVLYAGSLVDLMDHKVGPGFAAATGDGYQGFGAGSQAAANAIKGKVRRGDVFISASPTVQASLEGAANGDWVRWYSTFATAPLVLGYSSHSRFAARLRSTPWYDVITQPGFTLGITDPTLDPKGVLSATALRQAQADYHLPPSYAATVLHRAAVFPEEELLGRLETGQLDAGFFYTNEAVPAHLPTVGLGKVRAAASFSVTVLRRAPDERAGVAFVRYLLTRARPLLRAGGLHLVTPSLTGSRVAVPQPLRRLVAPALT